MITSSMSRGIESCAGQQRVDGDASEFVGGKRGEVGAGLAKWRANAVDDDETFLHDAVAFLIGVCVVGR